jgi:hypothetical protein
MNQRRLLQVSLGLGFFGIACRTDSSAVVVVPLIGWHSVTLVEQCIAEVTVDGMLRACRTIQLVFMADAILDVKRSFALFALELIVVQVGGISGDVLALIRLDFSLAIRALIVAL